MGFSLHLTIVFLKEPVTYRWSDSQNSTGDEVLVFMSSYIETQMLKTLQGSGVFGVQFYQVLGFPAVLAYFCRGLLFSPWVKALPLCPLTGALHFFANLVGLPFNSFRKTAKATIRHGLIRNWAEFYFADLATILRRNCTIHSHRETQNMQMY